jgi:hypothetical protein
MDSVITTSAAKANTWVALGLKVGAYVTDTGVKFYLREPHKLGVRSLRASR